MHNGGPPDGGLGAPAALPLCCTLCWRRARRRLLPLLALTAPQQTQCVHTHREIVNGILKRRRSSCKAFVHELSGLKLQPSEQARGQGFQKVGPGSFQLATAAVGIAQQCP